MLLLFLANWVVVHQVLGEFFLLFVVLGVPVHIKSTRFFGMEKVVEVFLELFERKLFQNLAFLFLSVELVLVGGKFIDPESSELLIQILVFLLEAGQDCFALFVELFLAKFAHFLKHVAHVFVKAWFHVWATFTWRLDQESGTNNISSILMLRKHNITQLLNGPKLVESRLIQELETHLINQLSICTG